MGTINYGTSDYITMGLKPIDVYDVENDVETMDYLREEVEEYGGTIDDAIYSYINDTNEGDYYNIEYELKKHCFVYYHIAIKNGYYDGFYLDIETNNGIAFDSWQDKREAQKEITEIKQFLKVCAGMGLCAVHPGWCTRYSDYSDTIKAIDDAIRQMREEAKNTPTWRQYERECA